MLNQWCDCPKGCFAHFIPETNFLLVVHMCLLNLTLLRSASSFTPADVTQQDSLWEENAWSRCRNLGWGALVCNNSALHIFSCSVQIVHYISSHSHN